MGEEETSTQLVPKVGHLVATGSWGSLVRSRANGIGGKSKARPSSVETEGLHDLKVCVLNLEMPI